jgi:hypothetical protein
MREMREMREWNARKFSTASFPDPALLHSSPIWVVQPLNPPVGLLQFLHLARPHRFVRERCLLWQRS